MTDTLDNGGPAFPTEPRGSIYGGKHDGMTLRDWFAGQALAGVINTCSADILANGEAIEAMFARKAYSLADAMIRERTK